MILLWKKELAQVLPYRYYLFLLAMTTNGPISKLNLVQYLLMGLSSLSLERVAVVGHGAAKKSNLSGAVSPRTLDIDHLIIRLWR